MKKIVVLFTALFVIFIGAWIIKTKSPINRPDSYSNGLGNGNYWWTAVKDEPEEVNTNWQLAAGVPSNYIPVPGKQGLYMIVDEDGYITGYKSGTKDGSGAWEWKETNPDIPENYEAVPGLTNVYKVTYDDGSVSYFKYVRNKDDTFAFVEVDAKGNMIGMAEPSGATIPENYERVSGNQYAVKNQDGIVIAFKERITSPESDDGFEWINIDEADLTDMTMPDVGFDLTSDVTGKGDITGGIKEHAGFNTDAGSMTAMAVPTLMPSNQMEQGGFVFYTQPTAYTFVEEVRITPPPGMTTVIASNDMSGMTGSNITFNSNTGSGNNQMNIPDFQLSPNGSSFITGDSGNMNTTASSASNNDVKSEGVTISQQGVMVSKEVVTSTKQEGNYLVTYSTTYERTYDKNGNLLGEKPGETQEVSRKQLSTSAANESPASSLNDEYARMCTAMGTVGARFNSNIPNKMVSLLNNERGAAGIPYITFNGNSHAYKIALCRAMMMALTGSSNNNLQGYGSLSAMCSKYGISTSSPSENMLITNVTSAEAIHSSFMSSSSKDARMSPSYSEIAIAIVEKDGRYYIDEVFVK